MFAGFRYRWRLKGKGLSSLGGVAVGERVKIAGRVESEQKLLKAPITGRACVFYQVEIGEWFNGSKTPLLSEASPERFALRDSTGLALIDPMRADVYLRPSLITGHSGDFYLQHRALLRRHGYGMVDEYGELRSLAFRETIIAPDETITALGEVREEVDPAGATSYRELAHRSVLGSGKRDSLLLCRFS